MSEQTKAIKEDSKLFIEELEREIEKKKMQRKRSLYRVNEKITDEVAKQTKIYFEQKRNYTIDLQKCKRVRNQWDIIITFL